MSKWYGAIGFAETEETVPGVWEDIVTEKYYFGDIIKHNRMLQGSVNVNDNINVRNQISIVSDAYAERHIYDMRYIVFQDAKWKITDAEVQERPRILLSLGGLWNGN